jgi:predicted cupin superfamily sugar epimerase
LLTPDTFSDMHRLPTDELWLFHLGDPIELLLLHPDGRDEVVHIGTDLAAGELPQMVARATRGRARGCWRPVRAAGDDRRAGFDFAD